MIVGGVVGAAAVSGPPQDLIEGDACDDIVSGFVKPAVVTVDEIRADPGVAARVATA